MLKVIKMGDNWRPSVLLHLELIMTWKRSSKWLFFFFWKVIQSLKKEIVTCLTLGVGNHLFYSPFTPWWKRCLCLLKCKRTHLHKKERIPLKKKKTEHLQKQNRRNALKDNMLSLISFSFSCILLVFFKWLSFIIF